MAELNLQSAYDKLGSTVQAMEDKLRNTIETADPNKPQDLMKMQQEMQQWTLASNIQSNTIKAIGEGMKSTVQNIR